MRKNWADILPLGVALNVPLLFKGGAFSQTDVTPALD
jgi:hypothetical protein